MEDKKFEIICRHKDTHASNLNEKFQSYGCNILEAKVPVVNTPTVEQLTSLDDNTEQMYASLALKAKSANLALDGRAPRTKDRDLSLVKIGDETIISAGKIRERSPVDEDELDNELDEYMKKAAELKQMKKNIESLVIEDRMEL